MRPSEYKHKYRIFLRNYINYFYITKIIFRRFGHLYAYDAAIIFQNPIRVNL